MKLNPEFKTAWIKALRSGEYTQGTRTMLDSQNRFCCLGVACRISNPELSILGNTMPPANLVAQWFGVPEDKIDLGWANVDQAHARNFTVRVNGQSWTLPELNDGGCDFLRIADIIEEQL